MSSANLRTLEVDFAEVPPFTPLLDMSMQVWHRGLPQGLDGTPSPSPRNGLSTSPRNGLLTIPKFASDLKVVSQSSAKFWESRRGLLCGLDYFNIDTGW